MAGAAGRLIAAGLAAALLAAAGPATPRPAAPGQADALAGRYSQRFRNGLVDGSSYWSENIVEIVPVDRRHAYLRFDLQFFNGHICSLAGIAEARGSELVYREAAPVMGDDTRCSLHVRRDRAGLSWSDEDGTCKSHCGVRGSFLHDSLPWKSRRPITYLARLKASRQYRDAMTEWRTGKSAF